MSRRASRIDGNHNSIADALRAAGCSVQSLAEVGDGCPDLLVGTAKFNVLLEIKDPSQDPCKRRLTPAQKDWHRDWLGRVHLVETVDQALSIVAFYRGGTRAA